MHRWKQRFTCLDCAHSAWREVMTDTWAPKPEPTQLMAGGFYCSYCGARRYLVVQVELLAGRWTDAFKDEGMRIVLMEFELSAGRDVEIRAAIRKRILRSTPVAAGHRPDTR